MTSEEVLHTTIISLKKVNEQQAHQLEEMSIRIKELTAQIAWFQRQMFGQKSEKRIALDTQLSLFDNLEESAPVHDEESQEETSHENTDEQTIAKRKQSKTRDNWENLPVLKTIVHEPEQVDLERYRKIGEEITYVVEHEPGKLYRVAHVRPKYGLIDPMEVVERGQGVIIAPLPLFPIYKGIPGASLLSEVLLQKYEYHMPFYRQIKKFAHLGMIGLKEATLTGWFKRSMNLLYPLYESLIAEILKSDYCQADETTTNVINHESHKADKEYLWMIRAVTERLAAFFYDEGSRAGKVIKDLTDQYNFMGFLQCDGFSGYTYAFKPGSGVTLINCLVHIRRYFEQALEENRKPATWFLRKIQELYKIEHECTEAGMTPEQRKQERLVRSKPIMIEMLNWMETEGIYYSERTLIGKAVGYAYARWNNMMHILDDGRLLLDNNLAENEIRSITIGRLCGVQHNLPYVGIKFMLAS